MSPIPQELAEHVPGLRAVLLARRRRLFDQVARAEDDLRWLAEDVESELVEEGQEEMLAQLLTRLDEQQRDEIAAIEHALDRMERGQYGTCRACAQPIPLDRLRAAPTTEFCVPHAKLREENARRGLGTENEE